MLRFTVHLVGEVATQEAIKATLADILQCLVLGLVVNNALVGRNFEWITVDIMVILRGRKVNLSLADAQLAVVIKDTDCCFIASADAEDDCC